MQEDIVSYFMGLIAIDSESRNERAMIDRLKNDLQQLGAEIVEEDLCQKSSNGNAGNLYAYFSGKVAKAPILFCAHVDTVTPGNNIKAVVDNGRIVSDGTTILGSDDKSGVAEIIMGIKQIKESGIDHAPFEVLFTISEEIGLMGAKCFDKRRLKSAFGYAFDTHQVGELVIGAPSQNTFSITIQGKEAHAGVEPEKGLSAIRIAAEAISAMPLGRIDFETTSNVGTISGGFATNIVPNLVVVTGEARSHNAAKLDQVCRDIRQAVESTVARYNLAHAKASFKFILENEYDAFMLDEKHPAVRLAQDALRTLDIPYTVGKGGGGSDANVFNAAGIPTIIVGTGMANVHTVAEEIEIDQLHRGQAFVVEMIKHYAEY